MRRTKLVRFLTEYAEKLSSATLSAIKTGEDDYRKSISAKIDTFNDEISELKLEIWKLKNPPRYNKGDKLHNGTCIEAVLDKKETYEFDSCNIYGGSTITHNFWKYKFVNKYTGEVVEFSDGDIFQYDAISQLKKK